MINVSLTHHPSLSLRHTLSFPLPLSTQGRSQPRAPLVEVDLSLLADNVGETAPNTADGCQGKHDLLLAIDVGIEHTQNVLEAVLCHQGLCTKKRINDLSDKLYGLV